MKYRIVTVFEGYVFDVVLELEGSSIKLSYDGDKTWKSTDDIQVEDGILDLLMICKGLNGTDWKLSLTILGQSKPLYEKSSEIVKKKYSYLSEEIEMPGDDEDDKDEQIVAEEDSKTKNKE